MPAKPTGAPITRTFFNDGNIVWIILSLVNVGNMSVPMCLDTSAAVPICLTDSLELLLNCLVFTYTWITGADLVWHHCCLFFIASSLLCISVLMQVADCLQHLLPYVCFCSCFMTSCIYYINGRRLSVTEVSTLYGRLSGGWLRVVCAWWR